MTLTIGISPCPNDTFLFDAMLHGKVDTEGIGFNYQLHDVEELNNRALTQQLDISKISYGLWPHIQSFYSLLNAGSALGNGVGPLLVTRKGHALENATVLQDALNDCLIATPGAYTTAHALLSRFAPKANHKKHMIFSAIADCIIKGEADAGVLIHEGRFTYQEKGLHLLLDLGMWWESTTDLPIPLGGIVMKTSLGSELHKKITRIMKRSLEYAWQQYPKLSDFVVSYAQEIDETVMRKHIQLYVNDYTYSLGNIGKQAIEKLCGTTIA